MLASAPSVAARALAAFIVSRNRLCLLASLARRKFGRDRRADVVPCDVGNLPTVDHFRQSRDDRRFQRLHAGPVEIAGTGADHGAIILAEFSHAAALRSSVSPFAARYSSKSAK